MGTIATAVSDLSETLRGVVDTMRSCDESLRSGAVEMSDRVTSMYGAAEENTAVTEQLRQSVADTDVYIGEVGKEIGSITELVQTARQALEKGSEKNGALLESSGKMVSSAAETQKSTAAKTAETKEAIAAAIEKLKELSKINEITQSILDISSQTNLLSLNASIEAARAGEAGRGFAVVADEIGKLANESADSVGKIQEIVKTIDGNIKSVNDCFDTIVKYLEDDVQAYVSEFAQASGQCTKDTESLRDALAEVDKVFSEISNSVKGIEEQASAVAEASSQNSLGIENLAKMAAETNSDTERIAGLIGENKDNAEKLGTIVSRFLV